MLNLHNPYNSYNIYFILECTLLVKARISQADNARSVESRYLPSSPKAPKVAPSGYEFIHIPRLPPRYQHLKTILPPNWYVPGKNKSAKRKHSRTHGVVSFQLLAKTVASNWRTVDPVTKHYVETVAMSIKERHSEIKRALENNARKYDEQRKMHSEPSLQPYQPYQYQGALTPSEIMSLKLLASTCQVVNTARSDTRTIGPDNDYLKQKQVNMEDSHRRKKFTFDLCRKVKVNDREIENHPVTPERDQKVLGGVGASGSRGLTLEPGILTDRNQGNEFKFGFCQEVGMCNWGALNYHVVPGRVSNNRDEDVGGFGGLMSEQVTLTLNRPQGGINTGFVVFQEVDMSDREIISHYLSA